MGARNQVGIGLSYRPASLCSLATQFQTRFLESIPRPIAGLKFSTLSSSLSVPITRLSGDGHAVIKKRLSSEVTEEYETECRFKARLR
jgi:hypothetical protein